MVVGRVIITAIRDTKIAMIVVAKMVAISVALAIGLDIAGLEVIGRNGTLSPAPTLTTLSTTFATFINKNFTANNSQQTHYQHEHINKTFERYLYSYD